MTSIDYNVIFESFLGNITDYDFANMSLSDSFSLMTEYLHKALAEAYVRRLFSSIVIDDETQVISYEMNYVTDDEADREFIIQAIAKWMVYEWLQRQVESVNLTAQFFGTKEQSAYSQANHLAQMRGLRDDAFKEARFALQDRGYINNSYIIGGSL